MAKRADRELYLARRQLYVEGWHILQVWAQCECPVGDCPLERYIAECRTTPGALLLALVLGRFEILEES